MSPETVPNTYVGMPVHYRSYGTPGGEYTGECRAATVTQVADQLYAKVPGVEPTTVGLAVLNPTGLFFHEAVAYDPTHRKGGAWHAICDAPTS